MCVFIDIYEHDSLPLLESALVDQALAVLFSGPFFSASCGKIGH